MYIYVAYGCCATTSTAACNQSLDLHHSPPHLTKEHCVCFRRCGRLSMYTNEGRIRATVMTKGLGSCSCLSGTNCSVSSA